MIRALTFNGKSFKDFNTMWDGSREFGMPNKDVEYVSVVGRNGDLTLSKDRYNNIQIEFPCYIPDNFKSNYSALMNYLLTQSGYGRLETTTDPDIYRMAEFTESVSPTTGMFNYEGNFTLRFNCKPQKWLKSGEKGIQYADGTSDAKLYNPTLMTALPLMAVVGTGTITINGIQVVLSANGGTTYIDCDIEDAYEGTINRNNDLTVASGFPKLVAGKNTISVSGCSITLYPRWWKL